MMGYAAWGAGTVGPDTSCRTLRTMDTGTPPDYNSFEAVDNSLSLLVILAKLISGCSCILS